MFSKRHPSALRNDLYFSMTALAAFLSFGRSLLNNRATNLYRNNGYGRHYHQLCAHEQCRLFSHSSLDEGASPRKASTLTPSFIIYEIPGKLSIGFLKTVRCGDRPGCLGWWGCRHGLEVGQQPLAFFAYRLP